MKFHEFNPKHTVYAGMLGKYFKCNLGVKHLVLEVKCYLEDGEVFLIFHTLDGFGPAHLVEDATVQLGTIFKWHSAGADWAIIQAEGLDCLGVDELIDKLFSMRIGTEEMIDRFGGE